MGASSWPRGIRSATSVVSVRDRSPSAGGRCRTSAIDVPGEAVGTEGLCGSLLKACQSQVRGVPKGPSSCCAIAPVRCQRTDARVHARTLAACSRSCRESHGGDAVGEAPEDRPGGACDEAGAREEREHAEDEPSPHAGPKRSGGGPCWRRKISPSKRGCHGVKEKLRVGEGQLLSSRPKLELLLHGHEAAGRGLDRDGTVNASSRELDELAAEALGVDE